MITLLGALYWDLNVLYYLLIFLPLSPMHTKNIPDLGSYTLRQESTGVKSTHCLGLNHMLGTHSTRYLTSLCLLPPIKNYWWARGECE